MSTLSRNKDEHLLSVLECIRSPEEGRVTKMNPRQSKAEAQVPPPRCGDEVLPPKLGSKTKEDSFWSASNPACITRPH